MRFRSLLAFLTQDSQSKQAPEEVPMELYMATMCLSEGLLSDNLNSFISCYKLYIFKYDY